MATIVLNNRDRSPLTREQIAAKAPTVLAAEAHESRSNRYLYVSSAGMLDTLSREGFEPVEIRVTRTRDEERRGHAKHAIRLAHRRDIETWAEAMNSHNWRHSSPGRQFIRPEISLVNSHDGTSAVIGNAGIFRLACYNGLTVAESEVASFKARHSAKYMDDIVEGVYRVLEETAGPVMAHVDELAARELNAPERRLLAEAAQVLRWPDGAPIAPERMLAPARRDDAGTDAWTTLNVLQEHAIRGGDAYRGADRSFRHTRPVTGIADVDRINRGIWQAVSTVAASSRMEIIRELLATMTPEERAALA